MVVSASGFYVGTTLAQRLIYLVTRMQLKPENSLADQKDTMSFSRHSTNNPPDIESPTESQTTLLPAFAVSEGSLQLHLWTRNIV